MRHDTDPRRGMSPIVKTTARWLTGFMLLFGLYLVFSGHDAPGGGFSGGAVVAACFIFLTLALGQPFAFRILSQRAARVLAAIGALIFVGMALAGAVLGDTFFESFIEPPPHATHGLFGAAFIVLCEVGIALLVAMSLFFIFSQMAHKDSLIEGSE